jgi:hypothetical protein
MSTAASSLAFAAAWAFSGWLFGLGYFTAIRRTVDRFVGRGGRLLPAALTLVRLAAALLFLGAAARFGALPLLTAFLGFLLARAQAVRAARRIA